MALADKGRASIRVTMPHPRKQFKTAIVFQSLVRQRENFFLTEENLRYRSEHRQLPGLQYMITSIIRIMTLFYGFFFGHGEADLASQPT